MYGNPTLKFSTPMIKDNKFTTIIGAKVTYYIAKDEFGWKVAEVPNKQKGKINVILNTIKEHEIVLYETISRTSKYLTEDINEPQQTIIAIHRFLVNEIYDKYTRKKITKTINRKNLVELIEKIFQF